jgi:hypothetical protein
MNGRSVKSASLERDESRRQDAASTEMQWAALDSNQRLPPGLLGGEIATLLLNFCQERPGGFSGRARHA